MVTLPYFTTDPSLVQQIRMALESHKLKARIEAARRVGV